MKQLKRVFKVGLPVSALLTTAFLLSAASSPKTTGDATWVNTDAGTVPAHTVFNAINISPKEPWAKGSLLYDDGTFTYTMDIQLLKVDGTTNSATFAGQITASNQGNDSVCCKVGNWVLYKVQDVSEPGIHRDLIWGEDMTASAKRETPFTLDEVRARVENGPAPIGGSFKINGGNLQVKQ